MSREFRIDRHTDNRMPLNTEHFLHLRKMLHVKNMLHVMQAQTYVSSVPREAETRGAITPLLLVLKRSGMKRDNNKALSNTKLARAC